MKLYCFGESGNAYKCALALTMTGTDWQPVFVDFFKGGTRTSEFRAVNEMGEVPVLVDGEVKLTQSGVILDYIAGKTGQLGASNDSDRREILRWLLWDNHRLSGMVGPRRFIANFLAEEKRPEGAIPFMQGRLKNAYSILNAHLEGRDWIVGNSPTIADLSCCGYLYYPEPFGFDRKDWPHIEAWLDRIAALPGWKHPYDLMTRAFPAP